MNHRGKRTHGRGMFDDYVGSQHSKEERERQYTFFFEFFSFVLNTSVSPKPDPSFW
jgi:hypothetical protein